jgi:transmembrane E3 ubiquitin-protein ligase
MFLFLALIVQVILSPTLTVLFVGATYSSIWLPQIVRSARRNRESGLAKEYIIGITLIRLASAMCEWYAGAGEGEQILTFI